MGSWLLALVMAKASTDDNERAMLQMGHDKYIESVRRTPGANDDHLAAAERTFSMAMVRENETLIKSSPKRKDLQIIIANITKNCCRLGDFKTYEVPGGYLLNRKAETLAVLTLNRVLKSEPSQTQYSQTDVWTAWKKGKSIQESQKSEIEGFAGRASGYTFDQHLIEYNAAGHLIQLMLEANTTENATVKQHLFNFSIRMIELTYGTDPLPYKKI